MDDRLTDLNRHLYNFVRSQFGARAEGISVSVGRTDLPNMFNVRVRADNEALRVIDAEAKRKAAEIDPAIMLDFV